MNYLVVVAHPDDEVLGAGATIHKLIQEGHNVAVVTMANNAAARANISQSLALDQAKALSILGVKKTYSGDFPNIKMNTVPHLDLVQFIEDTNIDHCETSRAVQAASRLFQRKEGISTLKLLLYMEVPSSTEWSLDPAANRFLPNYFVEVGEKGIAIKIKALEAYQGVMRPYPHPRSAEVLKGLAAYRGSQAGLKYAECFECVLNSTK